MPAIGKEAETHHAHAIFSADMATKIFNNSRNTFVLSVALHPGLGQCGATIALFDLTTARLVKQKILLPG